VRRVCLGLLLLLLLLLPLLDAAGADAQAALTFQDEWTFNSDNRRRLTRAAGL
jgi:hypothetical protein